MGTIEDDDVKNPKIAGHYRVSDWRDLEKTLKVDQPENWDTAYNEFFDLRIRTRYFKPIEAIQQHGGRDGAGFAIVALQCSLIEFLASLRTGEKYRHVAPEVCKQCKRSILPNGEPKAGTYTSSIQLFRGFLREQPPFCGFFESNAQATDFYSNVRCALLHEARTKGGWRIKIDREVAIDVKQKVIDRNLLQCGFEEYLRNYRDDILKDTGGSLRKAFIEKFDDLCA